MNAHPCSPGSTFAAPSTTSTRSSRAPATPTTNDRRRRSRDRRRRARAWRRRAAGADRALRRCEDRRSPGRSRCCAGCARRDPARRARGPRVRGGRDHGVPRGAARPGVDLDRGGIRLRELVVAVDRAGCYVPGGRASYPSTVLMTAIPARVAGVPRGRALHASRRRRPDPGRDARRRRPRRRRRGLPGRGRAGHRRARARYRDDPGRRRRRRAGQRVRRRGEARGRGHRGRRVAGGALGDRRGRRRLRSRRPRRDRPARAGRARPGRIGRPRHLVADPRRRRRRGGRRARGRRTAP